MPLASTSTSGIRKTQHGGTEGSENKEEKRDDSDWCAGLHCQPILDNGWWPLPHSLDDEHFISRFIFVHSVFSVPPCWVKVLFTISSKISLLDGAAGADLGRGTGFEHAAVDHDGEHVGDGEDGIHVVLDEQDGVAGREFAQ